MEHAVRELLRAHYLFADLSDALLSGLDPVPVVVVIEPGEIVTHNDFPAAGMLIVVDGDLGYVGHDAASPTPKSLKPGDAVGAVAFVSGDHASFTLRANNRSRLIFTAHDAFRGLLATVPSDAMRIAQRIAKMTASPTAGTDLVVLDDPDAALNATKKRRRRVKMIATLLIVALVGGGGYAFLAPKPDSELSADVPVEATTSTPTPLEKRGLILAVDVLKVAHRKAYAVHENYAGRVVSRRTSELGFERAGKLVSVAVEEGAEVVKGEILAGLDARPFHAQQRVHIAELQAKTAAVDAVAAHLALARLKVERTQRLFQTKAVSPQKVDDALYEQKALEAEMRGARAGAELVRAKIFVLDLDIEKSGLKAPYDGIVIARLADEGTAVGVGAPVIRLAETATKEVRVGIPLSVVDKLQTDRVYDLIVSGETYPALLRAILVAVDAKTRTAPAVFEIDDTARRLKDGQLATLKLERQIPENGFWIPTSAMIGGRRGLWIAYAVEENGTDGAVFKVAARELQLIHSEIDRSFVRGTLNDGDLIIASGLHRVVPGQRVSLK